MLWVRDNDVTDVIFEHFVDPDGKPLCTGGEGKLVTEANKLEYLDLLVASRLGGTWADGRWAALLAGVADVMPPASLHAFSEQELARVLGGEVRPMAVCVPLAQTIMTGLYTGPHRRGGAEGRVQVGRGV